MSPIITEPRDGADIVVGGLAYIKRASAVRQADHWNAILRDEPVYGPDGGYVVGVGERRSDGWPLVWCRRP